ncbi:MAG: DNA gyrase subunit A [Patescibacteria group bacterium]|nr:DNA gyrase subunit A [Patescibacteria group bacterium]
MAEPQDKKPFSSKKIKADSAEKDKSPIKKSDDLSKEDTLFSDTIKPVPEPENTVLTQESSAAEEKAVLADESSEPESQEEDQNSKNNDVPDISASGILPREISNEMEKSYLDYAMSVIVARALPDVRDGLKPVHRRIVYAMKDLGLSKSAKFRKSALVVGEVLGKYHPHGDKAVYDSMVRLAQNWSLRYTLVDGQGNFGSVDGDGPAAMRYTEARLERIADELVADIDKNTVEWTDNYDATKKEPRVLPTKIPQLLINGVTGIAVGMATNIPPHNLGEVIDGCINVLDNPDCEIDELMRFIKGQDFPTGAEIHGISGIRDAYTTGRGRVLQRAVTQMEEVKGGRFDIIVTEIPYMVNKSVLVEKIAELTINKEIDGIKNIRDESNREGMRVVIELKKDAYPQKILNQLYKHTDLQKAFHCNMIALIDNGLQPKLLNLKELIEYFLLHRKDVTIKRIQWELDQAKARVHILEGLKIALDHIDEVIETIKASKTKEDAATNLIKKFNLTEIQAQAILEIRLQTLAAMETQKITDELAEKLKFIAECQATLADEKKIVSVVRNELAEIKTKYNDERRTKIFANELGEMCAEDTIVNEPVIVTISRENYIKRMPPTTFKVQGRGGKGIKGAGTKDEDLIVKVIVTNTHDWIYFFTDRGRVFRQKVYDLPIASRIAKGTAIVNLLNLAPEEKVTAIFCRDKTADSKGYFFMATEHGVVKKTALADFANIRQNGLIALKIKEGDRLGWVRWTSGNDEIFLISQNGQSIRFPEVNVRFMGRTAAGVHGIRLKGNDKVIECAALSQESINQAFLLTISSLGYGKCTTVADYRIQGRGGSGIKTANVTEKTGLIVGARILTDKAGDLLMISAHGICIRTTISSVPDLGRSTQGVRMMRMNKEDAVASMTVLDDAEVEEDD